MIGYQKPSLQLPCHTWGWGLTQLKIVAARLSTIGSAHLDLQIQNGGWGDILEIMNLSPALSSIKMVLTLPGFVHMGMLREKVSILLLRPHSAWIRKLPQQV